MFRNNNRLLSFRPVYNIGNVSDKEVELKKYAVQASFTQHDSLSNYLSGETERKKEVMQQWL